MTKKVRPVPADLVIPAAKPKPDPIDNSELVSDFRAAGGKLLHFRPDERGRTRGMTVAFVIRSGHIELATAVQHRVDAFTRKLGTRTAIQHFQQGKTIALPLASYIKGHEISTLKAALGVLL
jgi:hypothetical protein